MFTIMKIWNDKTEKKEINSLAFIGKIVINSWKFFRLTLDFSEYILSAISYN